MGKESWRYGMVEIKLKGTETSGISHHGRGFHLKLYSIESNRILSFLCETGKAFITKQDKNRKRMNNIYKVLINLNVQITNRIFIS